MDEDSADLLANWKDGDDAAADAIFERYVARLTALARTRLSQKMKRRIDPEDVVQSVYRSFFRHARVDAYTHKRSGDLWRLLAAITINKLRSQVEFHRAEKRTIDREDSASGDPRSFGISPEAISREPSPAEAVALVEELEAVMDKLPSLPRQILQLRLQGVSIEEIAEECQRSERTIRRTLQNVRDEFQHRLDQALPE